MSWGGSIYNKAPHSNENDGNSLQNRTSDKQRIFLFIPLKLTPLPVPETLERYNPLAIVQLVLKGDVAMKKLILT